MSSTDEKTDESKDIDGLDFFPERRGDKITRTWLNTLFMGGNRDNLQRIRCERNVQKVIEESSLIKLLMSAIKSTGCDIDLNRHISCEPCSKIVTGGYDPELNQVVICQNTAARKTVVQGALAHEMIHMFDFCRANLNFKDLDHLVCTEIRAANLMHCSFISAMTMGAASLFCIKRQHRECVKKKALASVMAVRDIPYSEAEASFDKVFKKCYNDLEPLGRRLKRGTNDHEKLYRERYHYGYI